MTQVTTLVSVKHAQEHRPQRSPNFWDGPGFYEFVPGPEDPLANVLLVLEFKQLRLFFFTAAIHKPENSEFEKSTTTKQLFFFGEGAEVLEWLL